MPAPSLGLRLPGRFDDGKLSVLLLPRGEDMATAAFIPTPEALLVEHPVCLECGSCLVCEDPHVCPAMIGKRDERND